METLKFTEMWQQRCWMVRNNILRLNDMRITYIFHSGFAIETGSCVMVFDFWMDPAGVMPGILSTDKPIYVFSSHFHEDHFNKDIFSWKNGGNKITYILSKDILKRRRAAKEDADAWLAKGGAWQDGIIDVHAAGSTDSGVSWIVKIGGKTIFHAGDLNNWYARFLADGYDVGLVHSAEFDETVDPVKEEKRYLGELKDIRKIADSFDIAMFPIDGRIGNGYTRGGRQFIERFKVGLFVPMHFVANGFESAWRMDEFTSAKNIPFWRIGREGECIDFGD